MATLQNAERACDIVFLGLQPPVDDPELFLDAAFIAARMLALDLAHDTRFQMAELRLDVIKRSHRLDDVRIRVYGSHVFLEGFPNTVPAQRPRRCSALELKGFSGS